MDGHFETNLTMKAFPKNMPERLFNDRMKAIRELPVILSLHLYIVY
jgi:hypothetical protein